MISIVAAHPLTDEQAALLERCFMYLNSTDIQVLDDAQTSSMNAAITAATCETILLIDHRSVPLGDWHRVSMPQKCDLLGGIVRTYAGTRAGYSFTRSATDAYLLRRQAVALPDNTASQSFIDLPNEGCLLIRRSLIEKIGLLDVALPLQEAISDFALRALERGSQLAYDARLAIDRSAGAIEATLEEEHAFSALRSDSEWTALLQGPARRAELRPIHIIAHGMRDQRCLQQWLQAASYPVVESRIEDASDPRTTLQNALQYRQRNTVLIDLNAEPQADWLLQLVEATVGERTIGIATCDMSLDAHRILSADATATLIVNDRIPAQIMLTEQSTSFHQAVAELCVKAASLGIVTRSVPVPIKRAYAWKKYYLDTYTLESMFKTPKAKPSISVILLAASTASVHRYTTDALRSYCGEVAQLFVVVRSDAPKITARLRNHPNVELFVDPDDDFAGTALSRALASSTGDIIVLMRDDYLVAEHWLENMLDHLERLPQVGIVVPLLSSVPGVQNCESEVFADSLEFRLAAERRRQARAREAKLVDIVHMPSFVMRRSVLEKVGDFDEVLATSNYGVVDYCIRARTAGFGIALAEDVYIHHIPFEHSESPFDQRMADASFARSFAKKWKLNAATLPGERLENLIHSPLANRLQFIKLQAHEVAAERPSIKTDEERLVLLLPLMYDEMWQKAGNMVRKYLSTFTSDDPVTLAIGRQDGVRTSVIAARIRKMISENALQEAVIPDIVISDAHGREDWLSSLPSGPRYLLMADETLPTVRVLDDTSPSGLRRAVQQMNKNSDLPEGLSV